jgi:DNA polymerase III subunit epsilon
MPLEQADQALERATEETRRTIGRFHLEPGDLVVTGEMEDGRETWEARARAADTSRIPTSPRRSLFHPE